uniref:Phosphopantothenoylcysteine decarboxylase n=1 Tax=Glossina brevipalpis TaxID=37001 RepID=A0A1A9W118_9MUSC
MKPTKNIIIACSGSVATIKLPVLIQKLQDSNIDFKFNIKVIVTEHAKHFIDLDSIRQSVDLLDDEMEWKAWNKRGDPVVHIDLGKWADLLVIAPLSANSLAKISMGLCDNLLMCVVRAWDLKKPLLFCPAMNTRMYDHPITSDQINKLKSWGYYEVPSIAKTLMCGDTGNGAMAEVDNIVVEILNKIENV